MKNALVRIVVLVAVLGGLGYLAYRLGVSNCREDYATQANKVQQVVESTDRNIREKVLSDSHSNNLRWLLSSFKRAD